MNKKIYEAVNAITLAMIGLLAGILTGYSVIWLWTFISPRAHFQAGPIGLVCKIVAIATIVLAVWFVPSAISYLFKNGKKYVRGELKSVSMNRYISMIKFKNKQIMELAAEAAKYQVDAAHYKAVAEAYKKELDSLESTPEE